MNDVPDLEPFDPDDPEPRIQASVLLKRYLRGEPFFEDEEYTLMKPVENDVYELRTPDLRIYGWFYRPCIFIAVCGDTMEETHSQVGLASEHRREVEAQRYRLDLNPPKYQQGAEPKDVFSV